MPKLSKPLAITTLLAFLFFLGSGAFYVFSQSNSSQDLSNNFSSSSSLQISIPSSFSTSSQQNSNSSSQNSSSISTKISQSQTSQQNSSLSTTPITPKSVQASSKDNIATTSKQALQSSDFSKTSLNSQPNQKFETFTLESGGMSEDNLYVNLIDMTIISPTEGITNQYWTSNRKEFLGTYGGDDNSGSGKTYQITGKVRYNPKVLNLFIAPVKIDYELYDITEIKLIDAK
jgi:hypothetical protein